jgi:hypothetical protein
MKAILANPSLLNRVGIAKNKSATDVLKQEKMNQSAANLEVKALSKSEGRYGKRHVDGEMNRTEESYAVRLEERRLKGEILGWWFEAVTFKFAEDARFKGDFLVLLADLTIEIVDVKGSGPINEASTVRAKACADKFWFLTFVQEKKLPKNAGWERKVF